MAALGAVGAHVRRIGAIAAQVVDEEIGCRSSGGSFGHFAGDMDQGGFETAEVVDGDLVVTPPKSDQPVGDPAQIFQKSFLVHVELHEVNIRGGSRFVNYFLYNKKFFV